MAKWLTDAESKESAILMAEILALARSGDRVQFLVSAGRGGHVVQRLRVALSRSRKRNEKVGKKNALFSVRHSIYPFTQDGKRHDCIVMWTEKNLGHTAREILDDVLEPNHV